MARIPCRKTLISKKNKKVRLDFATEHIVWTEEQWDMVHISDEYTFNLFGSDGKRFVRCKNRERLYPQCVKKTVKFGGGPNGVWDDFFSGSRTHCLFPYRSSPPAGLLNYIAYPHIVAEYMFVLVALPLLGHV